MRYGAETNKPPAEVLTRAREYFGPGGKLGLPETEAQPESVSFAGPDGGVTVTARATDGRTDVTILSREYDYWSERFLRELA